MGAKDIAERALVGRDDVFADAFNGLVFGGRQVVAASDLQPADTRTPYRTDARLRDQDRDVAKRWRGGCDMHLALLGVENQSRPDPDMALRVIGYDGAAYRAQVGGEGARHPVVTIVLYFGREPWGAPTNLLGRVAVPPELEGLVNDYQVRVYDKIGRAHV